MKNDSFLFPFSLPGDSIFDSDNDGKLTGFETAFRDAAVLTALEYLLGGFDDKGKDVFDDDDDDLDEELFDEYEY